MSLILLLIINGIIEWNLFFYLLNNGVLLNFGKDIFSEG